MAALGAEVIVTKNAPPDDPDNFQTVARRLATEHGWFLTDQFRCEANVRAHEETTAVEILEHGEHTGHHRRTPHVHPPLVRLPYQRTLFLARRSVKVAN